MNLLVYFCTSGHLMSFCCAWIRVKCKSHTGFYAKCFNNRSAVFCLDVLVEENPAPCQILHLLEEGGPRPLTFILNANLLVNVKLVTCK